MTVGTFVQPDFESDTGTEYKTAIDNCIKVLTRIGDAFAPHERATPNMQITLDVGALFVSGALTEVATQDTAVIVAPSANPRIDRVVIDAVSGDVAVIEGTEAADPDPPDITTGKLPVCQVLLQTSSTEITNDMITDERTLGGTSDRIPVNGVYVNTGTDPNTELNYGTWVNILPPQSRYPIWDSTSETTMQYYVKATSRASGYMPGHACLSDTLLIGSAAAAAWISASGQVTNQRFHIDLSKAVIVKRLYYENFHATGVNTDAGVNAYILQGSNNATAFATLTYATDTNWTEIETGTFDEHAATNTEDPNYIELADNVTAYRYYALKFATNHGDASYMGVRRIELQLGGYQWQRIA